VSTRTKPHALIVMDRRSYRAHFDRERLARLQELVTLLDPVWTDELDSPGARARLATADVLITSWGVPALTADRLAAAPALRAVFHGAGSVRSFVTSDFWDRGVRVTSAADANAVPVAEFTLAAIIFAGKKAPFIAAGSGLAAAGWGADHGLGDLSNYRRTVGIVGFSRIGRLVVDMAACLGSVKRLVADPFADPTEVELAGATLIDLYELLKRSDILSLHAPDLPSTRHMIGAGELALLPDNATVINTARGRLIDTAALVAECRSGRLFAILDVTDPEPLPPEHPLRAMPNVLVTPHLAGSLGTEILRLSDFTLGELARWLDGDPLRAEVTPDAFALRA
jgi:phosphoglycerate dehydrogenase-like enzyme